MKRVAATAISLLVAATAAGNEQNPRAWLDRMNQAVDQRNYRGTFVHLIGNHAETMRVIHRVHEDKIEERLFSMDGSGREIIYDGKETRCILQQERQVLVEKHEGGNPLRAALPRYNRALDGLYYFVTGGEGRVAGRETRLIEVRPRDSYRYGYQLWLDVETAMPLQSALISENGDVVERVLFTEIEFPAEIAAEEVQATMTGEGFSWHVREARLETENEGGEPSWVAERVPAGFALSAATREYSDDGSEPTEEHIVYSDGLASVSVFVEDLPRGHKPLQGLLAVGPANTFSTVVGNKHQVTVVGEVPAMTVQMIGSSMRALRD